MSLDEFRNSKECQIFEPLYTHYQNGDQDAWDAFLNSNKAAGIQPSNVSLSVAREMQKDIGEEV